MELLGSRVGRPAKLSDLGQRGESVTLTEIQKYFAEMGEPAGRMTFSAALHQSGPYDRVASPTLL